MIAKDNETPLFSLPPQIATFAKHGVKMIPVFDDGRPALKWSDKSVFSNNLETLNGWWRAYRGTGTVKFRIFSFEPAMCGLFVLDLDRKNGVDGVAELQKAIDKIGFELQVEDLPAQTRTPNNGLHVYFRYDGNEKFMPNRKIPKLPAGVEVKHSGCLVTVPGSVKGGVQYRFAGSLEQAPELPEKLIDLLCRPGPQKNTKPQFQSRNTSEISLSLFSIQDILQKQGEYPNTGNRNRFCHEFTRFALKKGYETFEIIDYLRTIVDGFDTPEVNGIYAVMSAYKHFLKGIRR